MNPIAWWNAQPVWQRRLCVAALLVLALVGAFVAGRFDAPVQIQTKDVVRTETKTVEVEKRVEVAGATKTETKVIYRNIERKPDGTVIDKSIETTGKAEAIKVERTEDKASTVSATTLQEHTQTATLRPDWSISLGVGVSLPKPWLNIYGPMVLSVELDRRIVGGLSLGVMVNTGGQAFAVVKFEF